MATILVLQHSAIGHSGRLGRTLRDHGFRLDIRRVDLSPSGDEIPSDLDNIHGIVSLGGPMSANDSHAWIAREIDLLARAHAEGMPIIGICLGSQLLARALGGSVQRMARPEVGFEPVSINPAGQTETLLAGIPWTHHAFHAHQEHVTPPAGAVVLASSPACAVQIYKVGHRALGVQYHFEADRPHIDDILRGEDAMIASAGKSREVIEGEIERHGARFSEIADRLCLNIASFAFAFSDLLRV